MWEADPGQFPCLRGGERIFLTANTMSHRVRLGRRQSHHFGFLTHCHVKTGTVFDRSCFKFLTQSGWLGPGIECGNLSGTFAYRNRDIWNLICQIPANPSCAVVTVPRELCLTGDFSLVLYQLAIAT